jgi:hypothetical protein
VWTGTTGDAVALDDLAVAEVGDAGRQVAVLVNHLGHGQVAEALAHLAHAAQVVAVAVGQEHARGPGPPALGDIVARERRVARLPGAGPPTRIEKKPIRSAAIRDGGGVTDRRRSGDRTQGTDCHPMALDVFGVVTVA